jgi:hypothetical protein
LVFSKNWSPEEMGWYELWICKRASSLSASQLKISMEFSVWLHIFSLLFTKVLIGVWWLVNLILYNTMIVQVYAILDCGTAFSQSELILMYLCANSHYAW